MQSFQYCSRTVPYCQIKKDYDDVVSPIFGPPGTYQYSVYLNSQFFRHLLFDKSNCQNYHHRNISSKNGKECNEAIVETKTQSTITKEVLLVKRVVITTRMD